MMNEVYRVVELLNGDWVPASTVFNYEPHAEEAMLKAIAKDKAEAEEYFETPSEFRIESSAVEWFPIEVRADCVYAGCPKMVSKLGGSYCGHHRHLWGRS